MPQEPQDIEIIDFETFDRAASKFEKDVLRELELGTPMGKYAKEAYKKAIAREKREDKSRIQSIDEQNRILLEYIHKMPVLKMHDGKTFDEHASECDRAWKSHDWMELARLYDIEPAQEVIDQFEQISKKSNGDFNK